MTWQSETVNSPPKESKVFIDQYVNAKWSETKTGATAAKISKQHWD